MITKILEFEVKSEKLKEVIKSIEQFTHTVHVSEPGCKLYLSIQDQEKKNKFIHIMAFESKGAEMIHEGAGFTQQFFDVIRRTCRKEPIHREYTYIGGL
jgi:quinol monooxygenase YgiN